MPSKSASLSLQERLERNAALARDAFRRKHEANIQTILSHIETAQSTGTAVIPDYHPHNTITSWISSIKAALNFYGSEEIFSSLVSQLKSVHFERRPGQIIVSIHRPSTVQQISLTPPPLQQISLDSLFDPETFCLSEMEGSAGGE